MTLHGRCLLAARHEADRWRIELEMHTIEADVDPGNAHAVGYH